MKKITAIIAAFAIAITFSACKKENAPDVEKNPVEYQPPDRVMPIAKTPDKDLTIWEVLPEIPETPAAELEYSPLLKFNEETGENEESGGIRVTGYLGTGNAVRVPETIDGKPVVSVRFTSLEVEEIILPTTLQEAWISYCTAKYINIPCEDMRISSKDALEKVYIEDNVTVISRSLLSYEKSLEQVRMGSNVKVIEDDAFEGCLALKALEIPEGVEYIGDAFCIASLTEITLPSSLVGLHQKAFAWCPKDMVIVHNGRNYSRFDDELYKQFYPNDLLIYNNVVRDCWDISGEITVPDGVTEIADYAFSFQKEITKITLPPSVRVIHDGAFNSCEALTEVVIPEGVEELGALVFDGCKSLKKIALPDSLTTLEDMAFTDLSRDEAEAFKDFEVTYKGEVYRTDEEIIELYKLFPNTFYYKYG